MRKSLAGALIRLAHRIYPPKVTETTWDLPMSNTIHINAHGMDRAEAEAAVERVMRRRTLAQQRDGRLCR